MRARELDRARGRLSEQDVANLRSYFFGTVAEFVGKPKFSSNQKELSLKIAGDQVTHYRYAFAKVGVQDCKKAEVYGPWASIRTPLKIRVGEQTGAAA